MTAKPYITGTRYQLVYTSGLPLAMIIDDDSTVNITYFCYAEPGSGTAQPVWRIKVIDETGSYPVFKWADGDCEFDNVASDRTSLSYS